MNPVKLEIVQAGNPVLRQRARPLSVAEIRSREIQKLIESMRTCMHEAPGVGLAAPQLGLALQLAVIEDREEYHKEVPEALLQERERRPVPFHAIINPVLEEIGDEKAEFFEGCLSLSGFTALVPRARAVRVTCLDERGEQQSDRSFRMVCADPAARDRSPARHALHRPHADEILHLDGKFGGVLEGQAGERDQGGSGIEIELAKFWILRIRPFVAQASACGG